MKAILLTTAALGAMAMATPGTAQEANSAPGNGLAEIVVTAQKRVERLQDVPVAVSAVTGDALRSSNFVNLADIRFLAPAVQFSDSNTTRGQGFQVRGIGTSTFSEGIEQSVGVEIDGVALGRPGMSVGDLVDVERIEVLRGPQGMLFGKNASAGLISVRTRNPVDRLEGSARFSYGTGNELRLEGVANAPLGENSALRLVGFVNRRDGFVTNVANNAQLNARKEYGFRGKLSFKSDTGLSVLLSADWMRRNSNCCTFVLRSVVPGSFLASQAAANGIVASPRNSETALNGATFLKQEQYGGSVEINYDLGGDYTLTSLTAYREWKEADNFDSDLSTLAILDINGAEVDQNQITQELRLTSPKGETLDFVAGAYIFDQTVKAHFPQAGTLGVALPPGVVFSRDTSVKIDTFNYAFFGQANVHVAKDLTLIIGGRYTNDNLTLDYNRQAFPGQLIWPGLTALAFDNEKNKADNFSWRLGAQYNFQPDVMAYFTASRGYKGPGFTGFSDYRRTFPTQVAPEIPTSFEVGLKSTLLDRRLILNLAAFTTDFRDFQAQVFDLTVTPGAFRVANAGKLRTRGIEMDFTARPVEGLTLNGSAAYVDAYYVSFPNIACYRGQNAATGCLPVTPGSATLVTNASGNPLPNSPKYSFALAAAYERPLNDTVTGFFNMNYSWRDKVNFTAQLDPGTIQSAYGLFGGQIGIRATDNRWSLGVFARNLFNSRFVGSIGAAALGVAGEYSQFNSVESSRTVGAVLNVRLGE